jgi:hypothetical protein
MDFAKLLHELYDHFAPGGRFHAASFLDSCSARRFTMTAWSLHNACSHSLTEVRGACNVNAVRLARQFPQDCENCAAMPKFWAIAPDPVGKSLHSPSGCHGSRDRCAPDLASGARNPCDPARSRPENRQEPGKTAH